MSWTDNTIMFWNDAGVWKKVTDHGRSPLSESIERIENKQRMANGTLRRYSVAKKRTWSCSWDNLPSTNTKGANSFKTVDGGMSGEEIEAFHNKTNGAFQMRLRRGDTSETTVTVMITDFSKDIVKRGIVDLWSLDITLEEV
jgi:hypothetical protein